MTSQIILIKVAIDTLININILTKVRTPREVINI